jgi:predicted nuclease of predicted toxin-antitoxin system
MKMAADAAALQGARNEGRMIATLDADVRLLMATESATQPSIIRIRIEGLRGDDVARLLEGILRSCRDDLAQEVLVTVQENGIRLRRLPLPRPS